MKLKTLAKIRAKLTKGEFIKNDKQLLRAKKHLASYPIPKNNIERSFFQYKTQRFATSSILVNLFDNLMASLMLKKNILKWKNVEIPANKDNDKILNNKKKAVFFNKLGLNIVPDSLKEEFNIIEIDLEEGSLIDDDILFINIIKKQYKLKKYFVFKIACKIAQYRTIIKKHNPSAIFATSEYSFTSSVLTEFCRRNGVEHINIMHGEKLYDLISTFFEFDRCYVWDQHYVDMFVDRGADNKQFLVEKPQSMNTNFKAYIKKCDYKYFLADDNESQMKIVQKCLTVLKNKGFAIKVRLHPLYSNLETAYRIFGKEQVENPLEVGIEQSIGECTNIIARFSTVLNQAYNGGINVVIDDITSKKQYDMLKKLCYIMMFKENVFFLSSLIKEIA